MADTMDRGTALDLVRTIDQKFVMPFTRLREILEVAVQVEQQNVGLLDERDRLVASLETHRRAHHEAEQAAHDAEVEAGQRMALANQRAEEAERDASLRVQQASMQATKVMAEIDAAILDHQETHDRTIAALDQAVASRREELDKLTAAVDALKAKFAA